MELFVVDTGNRFEQILIFTEREDAANWLRRATRLDEKQIDESIHLARRVRDDEKYLTAFLDA